MQIRESLTQSKKKNTSQFVIVGAQFVGAHSQLTNSMYSHSTVPKIEFTYVHPTKEAVVNSLTTRRAEFHTSSPGRTIDECS